MNQSFEQSAIQTGMPVYGVDGVRVGEVESLGENSIHVRGHRIPAAAIDHIDQDAVHLHLARAAFLAHQDADLAATNTPGA